MPGIRTTWRKEADENEKSSVLYFNFIGLDFLLCGDAPIEIEKEIITTYTLDVDVIKIGHHGSNTSSSKEFIQSVKPEVAIISVGRNNRYNHPHSDVISTLNNQKVVIFRTDQKGSVKISKNIMNDIIINTKL